MSDEKNGRSRWQKALIAENSIIEPKMIVTGIWSSSFSLMDDVGYKLGVFSRDMRRYSKTKSENLTKKGQSNDLRGQ